MPASEQLSNRLREIFECVPHVREKKMFSGIAFMVNNKMCINVRPASLMVRIDPAKHEELIEKRGCMPVVMRGREIKGFVDVDEEVLGTKRQLDYWVGLALKYNPRAKVSKKKKAGHPKK